MNRLPPSPDHPAIRHLQALKAMCDPCSRDAVDVAIDAVRALSEMRPKHPKVIVGQRYAQLIVSYPALQKAQKALGAFDLGPPDLKALMAEVQADRDAHNATLDSSEHRAKWGRP